MQNSKLVGGVLLIVGTSIGGGMLALPIATAAAGFANSFIFLVLCWLVMTIGALLILEVNLRLPPGSNMISMAKETLGLPGQIIAWIAYLVLLYTLLSAYISGGGDILQQILQSLQLYLPNWMTALLFTGIFSAVIYSGIHAVDYVNRGFMFGKFAIYLILVLLISPYMNPIKLSAGSTKAIASSIMVLITSFGFASIVPSLRDYFKDDLKSMRKVIILGSLIPLVCYIAWNAVIMGVVARNGQHSLIALTTTEHATSGLIDAINTAVHSKWITAFFSGFSSICMVTAFLGVSIGLFDFLADGLKLKKQGLQGYSILGLTFVPPIIVVLFKPGIYLHAFAYAGICCVILLLLLPALMTWRARTIKLNFNNNQIALVPGGYLLLTGIIFISLLLLIIAIFN